jgi:hypothetical protein
MTPCKIVIIGSGKPFRGAEKTCKTENKDGTGQESYAEGRREASECARWLVPFLFRIVLMTIIL